MTDSHLGGPRIDGPWRKSWAFIASNVMMIITALALPAASASAGENRASVDIAAVDQFIQRALSEGSIPGAALAITHGDEGVYVRGYGHDSSGYPVTGRTLFLVSGETFDAYLRRHVFEPAGMQSSSTTNFDDDPVEGLVEGHVVAF